MTVDDALGRLTPQGIVPLPVARASFTPAAPARSLADRTSVTRSPLIRDGAEAARSGSTRLGRQDVPAWVRNWVPAPGSYGQCPEGGSHLVLICDESGSVHGADPIRYRYALLAKVLTNLASSCTCHQCTAQLVLFGITKTKPSDCSPAVPWDQTASLQEKLTRMPFTGSYLRPAMDQVEGEKRRENTVTVCLTDLELFDDDPSAQEARFAAQPNPLLILLGGAGTFHDPTSPFVAIDGQSDRTAVADAVAAHITATRPPAAAPAAGGGRRTLRPRFRGKGLPLKWLGLAAGALAALLFIPMLASQDDDSTPASEGAGSQQDQASQAIRDEGFTIPGLGGDVPRTVPMNAAWVIDASLADDASTLRRIRKELPAVTEHLQDYRIPGDTLALGSSRPQALAEASALQVQASGLRPSIPARLRWKNPEADRMLAVITNRPGHWQRRLAKSQGGKHSRRNYIIDTSATGPVPRTLPSSGPQGVPADAQASGSVAQAVARAWGDAIGARWLG